MITRTINGKDYNFATTLRVAYKVQSYNNHTSYSKVLREISDAPIEKQVEVLYAAYQIAEPEASLVMKFNDFFNEVLDNCTTKDVMNILLDIVMGIMGPVDEDTDTSDEVSSETKN